MTNRELSTEIKITNKIQNELESALDTSRQQINVKTDSLEKLESSLEKNKKRVEELYDEITGLDIKASPIVWDN